MLNNHLSKLLVEWDFITSFAKLWIIQIETRKIVKLYKRISLFKCAKENTDLLTKEIKHFIKYNTLDREKTMVTKIHG